jgi:ribosomal-protein-alanine N-acetyltransferase
MSTTMHHEVGQGYLLRKPEPKDVEPLYRQKNDPEVASLLVGFSTGYSRTDLSHWVEAHRTCADEALYVIADQQDAAVGHVGLYQIDTRARTAQFGIMIGDKAAWGRGLGRACTRAMVEYGFDEVNLRRIYLDVLESNVRAQRVYQQVGFVVEGRLRQHQFKQGRYQDIVLMGLLADEYSR